MNGRRDGSGKVGVSRGAGQLSVEIRPKNV